MYIMLAGSVLLLADDNRKLRRNTAVAAVVLLVLAIVCLPPYYTDITKSDFRAGAQVLEDEVQPGDTIIYAPHWENMVYGPISFYYDMEDHGAIVRGVMSDEEFTTYLSTASGTVYVIVLQEFQPFQLLDETDSPNCQKIHESYRITVWRITGPIL